MTKQRIALITGGVGGIGTAICYQLTQQNVHVFANYYPSEADLAKTWQEDQKKRGVNIDLIGADVASYTDCEKMVETIEAKIGTIDILVNAAGITRDKTIRKMDPVDWNAVIDTNLNSVFNVSKQIFPGMTERGFGRIINISSVNGQRGQFGQTNYSAAKAGMHGFTMALAQEGAAKGVCVNTISPGYISTPMTQAMSSKIRDQIVSGIPARKMGQPEDIANLVCFLASDNSSYITGANIPVNGGLFMSF